MAKGTRDVILRDRMQFAMEASGNRTTQYGRIDLSGYVNTVQKEGLAIKEVLFHVRQSAGDGTTGSVLDNTGIFVPVADWQSGTAASGTTGALKIFATTRAYENASEVGIASPDVLCVRELVSVCSNQTSDMIVWHDNWYGPKDLHPEGYTVVSDLLVGIAADNFFQYAAGDIVEIDILLIAEPIKVSTDRMNQILSQAQDL